MLVLYSLYTVSYTHLRDAVSGEAQATESDIDNGDVEDKRAGEDAGRGSGTESDSDAIPLESDDTEPVSYTHLLLSYCSI